MKTISEMFTEIDRLQKESLADLLRARAILEQTAEAMPCASVEGEVVARAYSVRELVRRPDGKWALWVDGAYRCVLEADEAAAWWDLAPIRLGARPEVKLECREQDREWKDGV